MYSSVLIKFSWTSVMKLLFMIFLGVALSKFENFEITEAEIWAKSPMESQFNLRIIQNNFQGLYDDVFAGIEGRIAGGQPASDKQFPHQALMYMVDEDGNTFICGGSLVSFNWVLTAAHCIYNYSSITVHLGTVDRIHQPSAFSQKITNKNHQVVHPFYNPQNLANDIALLFLQSASIDLLKFQNIATISLPLKSDVDVDLVGMSGTVSGFGSTSDTNKAASDKMRYVTMPIISNLQCQRTFGAYIRPSNVCLSGKGGKSVCSGDSGSGMTVKMDEKRTVLAGIVSFGHKHSCTLGHPGVFVRVTSYLDWIERYLQDIPRETEDGIVENRGGFLKGSVWVITILIILSGGL